MIMDKKYGVNSFIKEVHVKAVDFDETFKLPEYRYVVEIVNIHEDRGNGLHEMKIYTEGNLTEFHVGNWKISPIIKIPFNWTGYYPEIELIDSNSNIISKKGNPDSRSYFEKGDFVLDIKWVFESIKSLENVETVSHFQFLEDYLKLKDSLNSFIKYSYGINTYIEYVADLNSLFNKLKDLKTELKEKSYFLAQTQFNEIIDLFNKLELKRISN